MNVHIDQQGSPIVNDGVIHREGPGVVALSIDMKSKHCVVGGTMGTDNTESIIIEAVEGSLHLAESVPRDKPTIISFPDYSGWRVWAAECARYTLTVCLVDG